jgi:glycosyltransferase involved in cell wall biosynthesis
VYKGFGKISIIIPAYNEEGRILTTLKGYNDYFSSTNNEFEIVVIANGCQDNTLKLVKEFSKSHPKIKYKEILRRGKGRAIIEGFKIANGDIIAFTDADGAIKPWDLHDIINHIGEYDVAIGSKYLKNSHAKVHYPLMRRVASRVWNLLVRIFLGLDFKDTQAGAKAFKREVVKDIADKIRTLGYAFDVALLWEAKKRGYSIKEVPLKWAHLDGSKFALFKEAPKMLVDLVKIRMKMGIK